MVENGLLFAQRAHSACTAHGTPPLSVGTPPTRKDLRGDAPAQTTSPLCVAVPGPPAPPDPPGTKWPDTANDHGQRVEQAVTRAFWIVVAGRNISKNPFSNCRFFELLKLETAQAVSAVWTLFSVQTGPSNSPITLLSGGSLRPQKTQSAPVSTTCARSSALPMRGSPMRTQVFHYWRLRHFRTRGRRPISGMDVDLPGRRFSTWGCKSVQGGGRPTGTMVRKTDQLSRCAGVSARLCS